MIQTIRFLNLAVILTGLLGGVSGLFIAYQSTTTTQTIVYSLDRHVSQRLIERATSELVIGELEILHLWLAAVSLLVVLFTSASLISWVRKKRPQ